MRISRQSYLRWGRNTRVRVNRVRVRVRDAPGLDMRLVCGARRSRRWCATAASTHTGRVGLGLGLGLGLGFGVEGQGLG